MFFIKKILLRINTFYKKLIFANIILHYGKRKTNIIAKI